MFPRLTSIYRYILIIDSPKAKGTVFLSFLPYALWQKEVGEFIMLDARDMRTSMMGYKQLN